MVPELKAIIKEIAAENSNYDNISISSEMTVGSSSTEHGLPCLLGMQSLISDSVGDRLKFVLLQRRLKGGYNEDGGTGVGWVHPEEITAEVRQRLQQRTTNQLLRSAAAPLLVRNNQRQGRRKCREKNVSVPPCIFWQYGGQ